MTVNRIDSAPDILRELKDIERQIYEQKERQIVGSDAVRTFLNKTTAQWDWVGRTSIENGVKIKRLVVSFYPEGLNGRYAAGLRVHSKTEVSGVPNARVSVNVLRRRIIDPSEQIFDVILEYFGDEDVRAKFFVSATGKGMITVV